MPSVLFSGKVKSKVNYPVKEEGDMNSVALGFVAGAGLGALVVFLLYRARTAGLQVRLEVLEKEQQENERLKAENEQLKLQLHTLEEARRGDTEKIQFLEKAQDQMREAFEALASRALQTNAEEFLKRARDQLDAMLKQVRGDWSTHKAELKHLIEPLSRTLEGLDRQVRELEQKREGAYQGLKQHLDSLMQTHRVLQQTTTQLVTALKSPTVRGRWGEFQLRRVVEMAGMTAHVDFEEQASTQEGRPDMVIHLPNGGILPVDAKTPMQAYLEALEATDEHTKREKLRVHSTAVRSRVTELGRKRYWEQFENTPELVVMFVPNDACLAAAFEYDGDLLEYAIQQKVILTTPVTLLALLKAVAYGWQQQQISENARRIAELGRELHNRLGTFVGHLQKVGKQLDAAVKSYNDSVGSLERMVMPAARRFRELGTAREDTPPVQPIERLVRLPEKSSE